MWQIGIHPLEEGYSVEGIPGLAGSAIQGPTRDDAVANIEEAIRCSVGPLEHDGCPVPRDGP